jgi:hypothetical protein
VVGLEGIARLADGGRVYFNRAPNPFGSMAELAPVEVASQAPLEVRREAFERMAGHAFAGEIVVDAERFPLSRVEEAWQRQAQGPHHKIVLIP